MLSRATKFKLDGDNVWVGTSIGVVLKFSVRQKLVLGYVDPVKQASPSAAVIDLALDGPYLFVLRAYGDVLHLTPGAKRDDLAVRRSGDVAVYKRADLSSINEYILTGEQWKYTRNKWVALPAHGNPVSLLPIEQKHFGVAMTKSSSGRDLILRLSLFPNNVPTLEVPLPAGFTVGDAVGVPGAAYTLDQVTGMFVRIALTQGGSARPYPAVSGARRLLRDGPTLWFLGESSVIQRDAECRSLREIPIAFPTAMAVDALGVWVANAVSGAIVRF